MTTSTSNPTETNQTSHRSASAEPNVPQVYTSWEQLGEKFNDRLLTEWPEHRRGLGETRGTVESTALSPLPGEPAPGINRPDTGRGRVPTEGTGGHLPGIVGPGANAQPEGVSGVRAGGGAGGQRVHPVETTGQAPSTERGGEEGPAARPGGEPVGAPGVVAEQGAPIGGGGAVRAADYGKNNKIFTEEAAAAALEVLRRKLGQVGIGLDPEMIQDGITSAGYHIEAGARSGRPPVCSSHCTLNQTCLQRI